MSLLTRKRFLLRAIPAALAPCLGRALLAQAPVPASSLPPLPNPPQTSAALPAEQVKEFVVAAHASLDHVQRLLQLQPRLINATWDWGNGDFETALGGASHMGRRDIALFLLERGARLDVFCAAMLGRLEIVRAAAGAFPNLAQVPGPHGIPLVGHAQKGGAEAAEVLAFLRALPKPGG